jgi:hypothetical protein
MANVYIVTSDGTSSSMPRIHCASEGRELQDLLEKNLDLIPGDQINPEEPRRWLLIKREMPVPDPSTGVDRWTVDFFLADQDATPTFVECKRFRDTRARREIVGQAFEYAANAHYYWSSDQMQRFAQESASRQGSSLEDALRDLEPTENETPEEFFEKVKENLRVGQIRIVFFLEDSPFELRSVVDFLNKQMERSEILLVECKIFEENGFRVVVPSLFGYTEEARRVKRVVTVKPPYGPKGLTDTKQLLFDYWGSLNSYLTENPCRVKPVKPQPTNFIDYSLGQRGALLVLNLSMREKRIGLSLCLTAPRAKELFGFLEKRKDEIEKEIGHQQLIWDRMPENKQSYIRLHLFGADIENREAWPELHAWHRAHLDKFHEVFSRVLKDIK